MRLQDHLGMLSWSLLDKGLYLIYGFIFVLIINYTTPAEYGLYSILIAIHTWIFTISDSFALQSIIQFGMNHENRKKVNLIGLINHTILTLGTAFIILILAQFFGGIKFKEMAMFLPVLTLSFILKTFCQKLIYRDQKMKLLFFTNLIFFGINTFYIVYIIKVFGQLHFSSLITGYIFGAIASSILSIILTSKELKFGTKGQIKIKEILNFNWKMTIVSLLYSMPRQLDTVFLKLFFTYETIGIYAAAKTIFRVFDEAMNAVTALVYPSSVRMINNKNYEDLNKLVSKTFSFGFFIFLFAFLILIFGGSNLLFNLPIIPEKFRYSLNYFNILLLSLPFLPFNISYSIMVAQNKMYEIMGIIICSVVLSFSLLLYVGFSQNQSMVPIGIASYYVISGLIGLIYALKNYNFKLISFFKIFSAIKNFLLKSS